MNDSSKSRPPYVLFSVAGWKQRLVFWAGAIIVGITIVSLAKLGELASALMLWVNHLSPWILFILCPLGLATTAWLTTRFFPGSERSGIPQIKTALEEQISSLVLTAIIFSGVTAYAISSTYIFFNDKSLILPWNQSWIAVPLCGVIGGFFRGLFSRIIINGGRLISESAILIVRIAFVAGFLIAIIGYLSGGSTFGTGYHQTNAILQGKFEFDPIYPFLKMCSTILTFFSGIPSGIFVPSLSTAAGLGANLAQWFPIAPTTAMILLTMTAYFSGMLQSPITSFVIVMEITDTHEILIPLMATAFFATGTSKLICRTPLYRALSDAYIPKKDEDKDSL